MLVGLGGNGGAPGGNGSNGGCGGGGAPSGGGGGTGNQGSNGGSSYAPSGGGGGGASTQGSNGVSGSGGSGGNGTTSSISGSSVTYAGGGGGGRYGTNGDGGSGGTGGGGSGRGGGAGDGSGGAGGSGVVIISYVTADFGDCTGGTKTTDGANTVHTFTSSGTFTVVLRATSPTVTTGSTTYVTSSSATLNGTVNANDASTTAWFNYGITSGTYTGTTTTQSVSGSSNTSVSSDISGLSSNTKYYYRIAASNSEGTAYGSEVSFTTLTPDNKPLGSVRINSDASYTNSTVVTLTLTATDDVGVIGYYASTSSSIPTASASGWNSIPSTTSYSGSVSYSLASGDESKTVYVWYKDAAGNVSSTASDSIILDTTSPIVTITSPTSSDTYTTTSSPLSLGGSASDSTSGISSVAWSNNKGGNGTASGTASWTISGINLSSGGNTITVTATDGAGNPGTDIITVTVVPPTPTPTLTITPIPTPTPTPTPTLTPEGIIVGAVVDALAVVPISGATVSTDRGGYAATTDAAGTYLMSNVSPGNYVLTASATGFEPSTQSITIEAGVPVVVDFALIPVLTTPTPSPTPGTAVVFGFVYDEDDFPLRGVTVTIEGNSFSKSAETDEEGYYRFGELAAGNYKLTYEKEDYKTKTLDITLGSGEVKNMGTTTMIKICKGGIYGNVVDIRGNPIEFVKLKLKNVQNNSFSGTSSDADGFFEFTDLDAGTYVITAKKKRYKRTRQTVKLDEDECEEKEIEIEMRKTSRRSALRSEE